MAGSERLQNYSYAFDYINSIQLKNFNHPTRGNFVVVMAGS